MVKKSRPFQIFCIIFTAFIVILVTAPLVSLAFRPSAAPVTAIAEQDTPVAASGPRAVIVSDESSNFRSDNLPIYDSLTVAERKTRKLETKLPVIEPYYGEKVVYLTFDDGPDPDNTPIILDILNKNQVKGTFFVIGTQVEKHPELLRRIYADGHAIGNHSYNHIYRELYQSVASYLGQLYRTDDIIRKELGVRPRISRAPGGSAGSFSKVYWDKLKDDGYIEVGWNISSGDASAAKAGQIVSNIRYQLNQKFLWNHAIVLMHDGRGHSETVKALPDIIKLFKEQGFEFRVINAETPSAW